MVVVPRWYRVFPGRPDQVAAARRFATAVLDGRPLVGLAELVVSELATNAVCHTASGEPGGRFAVAVDGDAERVRVAVTDEGAESAPVVRAEAEDEAAESGRGLHLVAALAKEWGVTAHVRGRTVWAELHADAGL